jgi:hypothetical protein
MIFLVERGGKQGTYVESDTSERSKLSRRVDTRGSSRQGLRLAGDWLADDCNVPRTEQNRTDFAETISRKGWLL